MTWVTSVVCYPKALLQSTAPGNSVPFLVISTTATTEQGHKVQQAPREVQRTLQLLIATAPTDTFMAGKVSLHGECHQRSLE